MAAPSPTWSSDHLVANVRVMSRTGGMQLREFALGVDALYLSARAPLGPALLDRLEDRRRWADQVRLPVPCELGSELFGMAPHAWGRYRYCLEHPLARIGLTMSRPVPTVRVQPAPRPSTLWGRRRRSPPCRPCSSPSSVASTGRSAGRPVLRLPRLGADRGRRQHPFLPGRHPADLRGR